MRQLISVVSVVAMLGLSSVALAQAGDPPVKMSRTGICHPRGGTYYWKTKNFVPYNSMEACIRAGGRAPRR